MTNRTPTRSPLPRRATASLLAAFAGSLVAAPGADAGTWTRVATNPPGPISLMILMSDGSVLANGQDDNTINNAWYRLVPDIHGSYVNGTWSIVAPMIDTRLFYSSQLMQDGRLFVAGGEYGTGGAKAEIYNPLTNTWTPANPPTSVLDPSAASSTSGNQQFYDSISSMTPGGDILIAPVFPRSSGGTVIYHPATNTWTVGPTTVNGAKYQDEASWVMLADGSILTVDPFGVKSERYIPATNSWVVDTNCTTTLYDSFGFEMGAASLLANGKAFFLGANGHTAIYTPSGTTAPGSWVTGPSIPSSKGTPDAPACVLTTGKVFCAVSPVPTSANHFPTPTTFYEYDPVANSFALQPSPVGSSDPISCYQAQMLALPDGSVMYDHFGTDVYIYRPTGTNLTFKPVINSISNTGPNTYHLTGTGLNGISWGAAYGDDAQMPSNYPIVRLTDTSGNIYYARTSNWSSSGVQTGAQVLSVDFTIPASLPVGTYTIVEVANQFPSDPWPTPIVITPPGPGAFNLLTPSDLSTNVILTPTLDWSDSSSATSYLVKVDTHADFSAPVYTTSVATSQLVIPAATLQYSTTYYWTVTASDASSNTHVSTPASMSFTTSAPPPPPCLSDFNGDKHIDSFDLGILLNNFGATVTPNTSGDANGDGVVNSLDLGILLNEFGRTDCP